MEYSWAVVGAGPAGIAAVGKLLDSGIPGDAIVWIDPEFKVGDFGTIWRNVPSNTKVDLFLKFLNAVQAFEYTKCDIDFPLNHADKNKTCRLNLMADPLQWVTEKLKQKVICIQDKVVNLSSDNPVWEMHLTNQMIRAKKAIICIGSEPNFLKLSSTTPPIIPLQDAMDSEHIKKHLNNNDTIAVFGSSHSAILVIRNLIESQVKRVINFYRSELLYAIYLENEILYDDSGLKGTTADWARENIEGVLPNNFERVYSNDENVTKHLKDCNKIIYATGFIKRKLSLAENYNSENGIIAPGLYGLGIAYPEARYNKLGDLEYRVGLWKFMDYLSRVLPLWLEVKE